MTTLNEQIKELKRQQAILNNFLELYLPFSVEELTKALVFYKLATNQKNKNIGIGFLKLIQNAVKRGDYESLEKVNLIQAIKDHIKYIASYSRPKNYCFNSWDSVYFNYVRDEIKKVYGILQPETLYVLTQTVGFSDEGEREIFWIERAFLNILKADKNRFALLKQYPRMNFLLNNAEFL